VYLIAAVISGGMSLGALFYLWPRKQQGEELVSVAPVLVGALVFSLVVYEIVKILRSDYVFYVRREKKVFSLKEFDSAKALRIGPLTGIDGKTIVLKLRWRPQSENTPKVKSFRFHLKTPPEPTATFDVQLIGQTGNDELEIGRQSIMQKIDLTPRGQGEQAGEEYEDWREITFPITGSFPQYLLKLNLIVDRQRENNRHSDPPLPLEPENMKMLEQIWIEIFIGLRLGDLKDQGNNSISNIADANICVN
jgi:hypothetical protein